MLAEGTRRGRPRKRLISIDELQDYLHVSRTTVYERLLFAGCPHFRIGHVIRFDLERVLRWCERQEWDGGAPV